MRQGRWRSEAFALYCKAGRGQRLGEQNSELRESLNYECECYKFMAIIWLWDLKLSCQPSQMTDFPGTQEYSMIGGGVLEMLG